MEKGNCSLLHLRHLMVQAMSPLLPAILIAWGMTTSCEASHRHIYDRKAVGLQFADAQAEQQNLPILKLPYGTWQASKYDAADDVGLSRLKRNFEIIADNA
jgi:hypothetical protein